MRWMHLVLAASVLAWLGCGGAPSGDVSTPSAVTDGHDHDHDDGDGHNHGAATDSAEHEAGSVSLQQEPISTPLQDQGEEPAQATEGPNGDESSTSPVVTSEAENEPATTPVIREVRSTGLAAHHAATTLVGKGDKLPELTVTDLEGNEVTLDSLREGARVLVLVFWDSQIDLSKLELEYLEKDLAAPRADEGVRVVAINRGETPEVVRQVIETHGVTFPVLLDPEATAFGQLATKTVPRTYVVDSEGFVRNLWVGFTGQGTISEIQKEIDAVLDE